MRHNAKHNPLSGKGEKAMKKPTKQSEVGVDVIVLSPCPFCGGEAQLGIDIVTKESFVRCKMCCLIAPFTPAFKDEKRAIKLWNLRH